MRYEFRPLTWTDKETDPRRSSGQFKASWSSTLVLLSSELSYLEAAEPVVFQVDVTEAEIRVDGMLRANAKVQHPGVAVAFQSKYGPLRYATDVYERQWSGSMPGWQANVRAIALALQALRAVDRYGVTRRGEQYTGWRAIEAPRGLFDSADAAAAWMRDYATELGLRSEAPLVILYRAMAKKMHPDTGGPRADWDRLDAAKQILELR